MLLKQSQSQQYKPLPTRAESEARAAATHRELAAIRQDALAMKEETLVPARSLGFYRFTGDNRRPMLRSHVCKLLPPALLH